MGYAPTVPGIHLKKTLTLFYCNEVVMLRGLSFDIFFVLLTFKLKTSQNIATHRLSTKKRCTNTCFEQKMLKCQKKNMQKIRFSTQIAL